MIDKTKITKGPVCYDRYGVSVGTGVPRGGGYPPSPERICNTDDGEYVENPNSLEDGYLIADAFNTFHTTGLTPSELAEQLEKAIGLLRESQVYSGGDWRQRRDEIVSKNTTQ